MTMYRATLGSMMIIEIQSTTPFSTSKKLGMYQGKSCTITDFLPVKPPGLKLKTPSLPQNMQSTSLNP